MKIKIILALLPVLVLMLLATPAYALGLGISPAEVNLDVPADGSAQVDFKVYKFTGNVLVELEDIPLRVEPTTIQVAEEGQKITLTLYGDESLGNQTYHGYIKFSGMGGGNIGVAIKVVATVNHTAEEGEVTAIAEEEEILTPEESLPEQVPQAGFPIIPIAGAIGGVILITLIVLVALRRRQ